MTAKPNDSEAIDIIYREAQKSFFNPR